VLSRRFQYSTSSIVIVLIILGILIVVNFMSTRHFARADFTQGKDFTISDSTKKVLGELDDIVNINAYFSKRLPPYLVNLKQQVKDILDEYKAYAHGNLEVKFIDPAADPALEQKMRFMGIPQAQLNIIEKDKAEVVNVYLGMAVMYEDKKEVIPVVQNIMTLEYDLTSAIVKVKRSEAKTIGLLTGHKEYDTQEDYETVRSSLEKQYRVIDVDISEGKKVPEDVNTLIVGGPKEKLPERDKYEIDQFLMRGGRIIFLIDPIDLNRRGLMATEIDSNLNDMLEHYGVKLGRSLVLDRRSNANASFSSGFVQYSLPYPFWPRITKQQFAEDSPMVNQLENLVLPWAGPVELVSSKVKSGEESEGESEDTSKLSGIELFKTSQYSWTKGKPFDLSPQQRFVPTGNLKSYPLAVAVSGKFKSFYAGKPVPKSVGAGSSEPARTDEESSEAESSEEPSTEEIIPESPETQIVVVGNARFVTSNFLGRSRANMLFFENAVDWMTLGEDLIGIRSRFVTDRPLKEISEKGKLFVRIINICGASLLVIAFGLTRFIFKRRAKKIFETYSALGGTG
jgi:ABC-2 type transport system permease protein